MEEKIWLDVRDNLRWTRNFKLTLRMVYCIHMNYRHCKEHRSIDTAMTVYRDGNRYGDLKVWSW